MVGALCIAGLLRGLLPANYWTQHLFQLASVAEMALWTRILSLRIEMVRRDAERSEVEKRGKCSTSGENGTSENTSV